MQLDNKKHKEREWRNQKSKPVSYTHLDVYKRQVKDYEEILLENLDTISDTKEKFQKYRELVRSRVKKLEEENINVDVYKRQVEIWIQKRLELF